MRDRGRELPHRRDAARVRQLHLHLAIAPFALACFCLGPLAILDVGAHAIPLHDGARIVAEGRRAGQESAIFAGGAARACFDFKRLAR